MNFPNKTLHIFGGGYYVDLAAKLGEKFGWRIVVRTGWRFSKSFKIKEKKYLKIFFGSDVLRLMKKGSVPRKGDIGLSFSAPWIFDKTTIKKFHGRFYNLHNQILPKNRGAGGFSWNILNGENQFGFTIHALSEKIDDGGIVFQKKFNMKIKNLNVKQIEKKFKSVSTPHVINFLKDLLHKNKRYKLKKNSLGLGSYWPRLSCKIHGWINWEWELSEIVRFIRAFSYPYDGASTLINGVETQIYDAHIIPSRHRFHSFQTGLVFRKVKNYLFIAHKQGILRIPIKKIRSQKKSINLGDRFFTPGTFLDRAMTVRTQVNPDGKHLKIYKEIQ